MPKMCPSPCHNRAGNQADQWMLSKKVGCRIRPECGPSPASVFVAHLGGSAQRRQANNSHRKNDTFGSGRPVVCTIDAS